MKKKSYPVTNIGSVSLLMVFIILCLVTFATLSLSSAAGDYRYSEDTAKQSNEYYNACNKAELKLKKIDTLLEAAYEGNADDYYHAAAESLAGQEGITSEFTSEEASIAFEEKVSDRKALKVILTLNSPDKFSDGFYRVTSWQEVSTADWNGNDHLKLFE